jgi:DNA replication protein DnaC
MDEALRERHARAQERIERERELRGITAGRRIAVRPPQPLPEPESEPFDFSSVLDSIPKLTPEEEAQETARRAAQAERIERDRLTEARRASKKRLDALKLPITSADELALLDGALKDTKTLGFVRSWLTGTKPWLTLCGSVGRGKTMAAAWALLERGGRYVTAREIERVFAARYGDELDLQEKLLSVGLLVIDDVGRERDAEGMSSALLEVIDQRRKGQRTIAITNLDKSAFLERYADHRLQSRLSESGAWGVDGGTDMRGKP